MPGISQVVAFRQVPWPCGATAARSDRMSTTKRKRLLFDWHIPGFLNEVCLDVPAYLRAMEQIRPDRVVLMGKIAFSVERCPPDQRHCAR